MRIDGVCNLHTEKTATTPMATRAFMVSASYDGPPQQVSGVRSVSEAGNVCRVRSPWSFGHVSAVTIVACPSSDDMSVRDDAIVEQNKVQVILHDQIR